MNNGQSTIINYLTDYASWAQNVSNIKGTGLGLNIVRDFVNKLGGELTFKSKEGKGYVFNIKFPYQLR